MNHFALHKIGSAVLDAVDGDADVLRVGLGAKQH